jgi:putative ABC transport system substrate-binding protein
MVPTGSINFLLASASQNLAISHQLPTVFSLRKFVMAGGLMSYGESLFDFQRRAASFVDKILKGAQPAD